MRWKSVLPVRFVAGPRGAVAAGLSIALATIPVALLGVRALGSGCPAGDATPRHQPAGYECSVWVENWEVPPPEPGTAIVLDDVSDATAPVSPPSVLAIAVAPAGAVVRPPTVLPGGAVTAEAALGLHVALSIKPAALWRDHPTDLSMGITLTSPEGARATLLLYSLNHDGQLVAGLRLRNGAGEVVPLPPDPPVDPLPANRWQRWEVGIRRAGEDSLATVEWWVDGTLVGRREGLALWDGAFTAATAVWTLEATGPAAAGTYAKVDDAYVASRPASDRLVLESDAPIGEEGTIVLFDARTAPAPAACTNDGILRGAGVFRFGNLLSSAGCASVDEAGSRFVDEIAVLSRDNAFLLLTDHSWTDEPGETLTRQLVVPVKVPVKVWIAARTAPSGAMVADMADQDVMLAIALLELNRTGLTLDPVVVEDVSDDAEAKSQIGDHCREDRTPPPRFEAHSLNVYYVSGGDGRADGWSCAIDGEDGSFTVSVIFIYVDWNPSPSTLTHELGHALSLEHVGDTKYNESCYSPALSGYSNLMWAGRLPDRNVLTIGQVFRVNTGPTSLVNRLTGIRTGPTRVCPFKCEDHDGACPRVTKQ